MTICAAGQKLFPLSLNQQNILDVERSLPGTSINVISTTLRIKGRVDFLRLQQSVDMVLAADASLRTRLIESNGDIMQYHADYAPASYPLFDFSLTDEAGIEHWADTMTREPMMLYDAPLYRFILFRINEDTAGLLIKTHHIISDGWSQVQLCNRIGQAYLDLLSGREPQLPPAPDYEQHVISEQNYLHSPAYERDKQFWQQQLAACSEPASLKTLRGAVVSRVGRRRHYRLSQTLNHAIYAYCRDKRVAPFTVYYMALSAYLKRTGGRENFIIGTPVYNRISFAAKQTTGMFVSTLPLAGRLLDEWSFNDFNAAQSDGWMDVLRHQRFPFSHMSKSDKGEPPFHIVLSYQNSRLINNEDTSVLFSGRWHYSGYQAEHLCIHLANHDDERCYSVDYDYLTQIFSDQEIDDLHNAVCRILAAALAEPDRPLSSLPLLSSSEMEQVVYTFNQTAQPIRATGLYDAFLSVVHQHPRRVAAICRGMRVTYTQLAEAGNVIAAALPQSGELIGLLLPRSPQLLTAMVGVMQSGCAWLILSPDLPAGRMHEIIAASGVTRIISNTEHWPCAAAEHLPVVLIDELTEISREVRQTTPDQPAYMVYTSGSTGRPKGVEISVGNLLNLALAMQSYFADGAVLSLCNISFDAFVLESAAALLCGRTIVLPDDHELENPAALGSLIARYGVGFIAITPSRLAAFMHNDAFLTALARLERIVCGGEQFTGDLMQQLSQHTTALVYNQYGPSETTVAVSCKLVNNAEQITIGRPMANCRLYVLDERLNPLPVGAYGQLYIGGKCVGRGYHNQPQLTAESFLPSPFELGDMIYKTGDIACWTSSGEVMLAGRADNQIKLRGLRVEPQEIATCVAAYPGVDEAAVRVWKQQDRSLLVAYYTSRHNINELELLNYAADRLPRYMLPAYVLRVAEIPLNSNGKLDESLLPAPAEEIVDLAPSNRTQQVIVDIFRRVLCRPELSAGSDYFLNGGDSLNAMETLAAIEEQLGCRLRVSMLYAARTAVRLDELISADSAAVLPTRSLHAAGQRTVYPLSHIQRVIYLEYCRHPQSTSYNMPGAFRLPSGIDMSRLQKAFNGLIMADDSLRTAFIEQKGQIFSVIRDVTQLRLENIEAANLDEAFAAFVSPFDLTAPPLLRAALWQDGADTVLLLDTHHLICDGMSTPLLLQRLDKLYRGETLHIGLTYKDYACYMQEQPVADDMYWQQTLGNLPPSLALPPASPQTESVTAAQSGARYAFALSPQLTARLEAYGLIHDLSPFMMLVGNYGVLLQRLSGQREMTLGTPVSDRILHGTETIVGPLINSLPLRLSVHGDVGSYLSGVRKSVLDMLDHQDAPLDSVMAQSAGSQLYQTMFSLRPFDASSLMLDGRPMEYLSVRYPAAKFPLELEAWRDGNTYCLEFTYRRDLYDEQTVALYSRCFVSLLEHLTDADATVDGLPLLSATDKLICWDKPNRTFTPYLDLPLQTVMSEAALLHPEQIAVLWHDEKMTFAELELRACRLAGVLRQHQVQPGDFVGLACRRTPDMLAALWAILKVGAAYVPFLTSYPAARIIYMLDNAGVKVVLCDEASRVDLPPELKADLALFDEPSTPFTGEISRCGSDPMYVLYTSGSTGQPKGVQVPQRAIANLLSSVSQLMRPHRGPVLCSSNYTFDIFITESLLALAQGLTVALADEEEMLLPWRLAQLITGHRITITQFTPSRLQMCLSNKEFSAAASQIEFVILVGEAVTPRLVDSFKQVSAGRFINMYGPTEAAVYVTAAELTSGIDVHIGTALANCRIYVLDEQRRLLPPTVTGELYLAGECLADGYINQPQLTDTVFVPDPYFPGHMMYKTGDMGRLRLDGNLECLGRLDSQIKLNGNRVELSEVEGALLDSGAEQAVVLAHTLQDGSTGLIGFITPADIDPVQVRAELKKSLPEYMHPSRLIALPQLPANTSGKIDLPRLRELTQMSTAASVPTSTHTAAVSVSMPTCAPAAMTPSAVSAPERCQAETLLRIWEKVLGSKDFQADVSFFEQGGSSLGALSVLSEYYNHGYTMTLTQFFAYPTAAEQAELLSAKCDMEKFVSPPTVAEPLVVSQYPAAVPAAISSAPAAQRVVLLTGATGYFGAHLLHQLLGSATEQVICLLRGGNAQRLWSTLDWYFCRGWTSSMRPRIRVVDGDITQERFGLPVEEYSQLADAVDCVYHAAADVRHFAEEASSALVNVTGTRQVIDFCKHGGAALRHISTASICGAHLLVNSGRDILFTETDFDIGQNWADNVYTKNKFLAEANVYAAMERGLDAKVFRLGRLVGRRTDGLFQRNPGTNALYLLVRGLSVLGALPEVWAASPLEMTAVDVAAEAVLTLTDAPHTAYHIIEPHPRPTGEIMADILPDLRVVSTEEFCRQLSLRLAEGRGADLGPLLNQWQSMSPGGGIRVTADITQADLRQLGFDWPQVAARRLLSSFVQQDAWTEEA